MDDKSKGAPAPDASAAAAAGTTVEKTAATGGDDLATLRAEVEKLTGRVAAAEKVAANANARADGFEKTAKELAEAGESLIAAASGARPGIIKAVSKGEDGAGAVVEKTAGANDAPKTPREAFKQSFQKPEIQSGVPGVK